MSADVVRFPTDDVRRHAGTVDRVAEQVQTARGAIREVSMDTQAYGQLCQFLPALLSPVFGLALDALNSSTEALQETAVKLRAAAADTEATDQSSARRIRAASPIRPGSELPL
ncbi:type VII secretion target [Krasilnikovia sp. M28-CT-15]|uniref:type VII secretion target n=1 Tax=Krasilnikovia sp. M28-CT-15 TaxID=3373540 RepID=UPI0038776F8C